VCVCVCVWCVVCGVCVVCVWCVCVCVVCVCVCVCGVWCVVCVWCVCGVWCVCVCVCGVCVVCVCAFIQPDQILRLCFSERKWNSHDQNLLLGKMMPACVIAVDFARKEPKSTMKMATSP
jgi:hypothetical protein